MTSVNCIRGLTDKLHLLFQYMVLWGLEWELLSSRNVQVYISSYMLGIGKKTQENVNQSYMMQSKIKVILKIISSVYC